MVDFEPGEYISQKLLQKPCSRMEILWMVRQHLHTFSPSIVINNGSDRQLYYNLPWMWDRVQGQYGERVQGQYGDRVQGQYVASGFIFCILSLLP